MSTSHGDSHIRERIAAMREDSLEAHADPAPEWIGDCDWCSQPVYSDQPHEAGNGGEGVMHLDCHEDHA